MTGMGISHGAITVVNAMPTGVGSTIGVKLETKAEFRPGGSNRSVSIINDPGEDTKMARYCVETAYDAMGIKEPSGWELRIESEIPVSRGLKSSSSACNAILHSVFNENDFQIDPLTLVKYGVSCAKKANVTVTGSFDDACGCEFGGLIITNNKENRILLHKDIEEYDVILHIPAVKIRKSTLDVKRLRETTDDIEKVLTIVESDPLKAMTMNGRIISKASDVDNSVAEKAIANGALGAGMSGSGPAIAIVVRSGCGEDFIRKNDLTDVLLTKTRGIDK